MNLRKIYPILVILFIPLLISSFAFGQEEKERLPKVIVFLSPTCQVCMEVKNTVMPEIEKAFGDSIEIEYRDITKIEDYQLLLALKKKYNKDTKVAVPLFYNEGKFLEGAKIKSDFRQFILESLNVSYREEGLPAVDLASYFKSFGPLAVIGAGLIDGINPCAFTVIIFFISFLALQGYRKRELVTIGLTFIFAVFLTYLLLGLGIFNFLYRLKGFWIVSRIANVLVGLLAIVLGVLSLFDFFKIKRSGSAAGLFLELPPLVKKRIHSIIGMHYRRTKKDKEGAVRPHILSLLSSALVTGFLVSVLEAICTGQVYLPTISFILRISPLKLEAWGYLVLYNLMFIVPLLAIFLFGLLGVTSEEFARLLKKHLLLIKILMAILFFGLGIFLLRRFNV